MRMALLMGGTRGGHGVWSVSSNMNFFFFKFLNFVHNFKGYFSFTVIMKYCLYSLCCIIHPWQMLHPLVCISHSPIPKLPLPLSPLVTTSLFSISVSQAIWIFFLNLFLGCIRSSLLHAGLLWLCRVGATLCCGAQASHCGGFSCRRAQALGAQASVVAARRLSSCGSRALECKLSSCGSPALEHRLSRCGSRV